MADIFLSYSSSDRSKAKAFAEAIAQRGWSVWWDRKIPLGKSWSEIIEQQLDAARCVIVLWSKESASSEWVNNEARRGKRRGILIPIVIEETEIPLEFEHMQAAHLMDWESGSAHSEMDELLDHISGVLGAPAEESMASASWPFSRPHLEMEEAVESGSQAETEEGSDQQLLQKAMTLWLGSGGAPDQSANAAGYFRDLAERGNETAQLSLGIMYKTGHGVTPDDGEAVKWFKLAADQGSAGGQCSLGEMYAEGRGVPQDDEEAVRLYYCAAELGHTAAMFKLGFMYQQGRGVARDDDQAVNIYRVAAEQDNNDAQNALGEMYTEGRGVPKDDKEAVKWYRKAAKDEHHAGALYNLAIMYTHGWGVGQNDATAVRLYRKAAELHYPDAQYALGTRYAFGAGVVANDAKAIKWFRKAAAQGHEDAQRELRERGLDW